MYHQIVLMQRVTIARYRLAYPASEMLGFAKQRDGGWELEARLQVLLLQPRGTHLLKFSLPLLRR